MFSALIIPSANQTLPDLIQEKTTFYPETKDYYLCVVSNPQIPLSVKEKFVPVVIDSTFVSPVRAFQHIEFDITELSPGSTQRGSEVLTPQPEVSRNLIALRSKLVYAISELLSPNRFHLQLNSLPNSSGSFREYLYQLNFDEIPCFTLKDGDFMRRLSELAQITVGPLIMSSRNYGVTRDSPPSWYLREMLRDLSDFGDLPVRNKVLIEGPSGNLYLFYEHTVNVTEDQLHQVILEIRGQIAASIKSLIFPRGTPDWFIKSRQLVQMANGQWTLPFNLPDSSEVFAETIELSWTFSQVSELFYFLSWLMLAPTYPWIERELEILVESSNIRIRYRTHYFPDYLRVLTACRSHTHDETGQIYYPDRIDYRVSGLPSIEFYDSFNNERAFVALTSGESTLPKISRTAPSSYDLETRLQYDLKMGEVM